MSLEYLTPKVSQRRSRELEFGFFYFHHISRIHRLLPIPFVLIMAGSVPIGNLNLQTINNYDITLPYHEFKGASYSTNSLKLVEGNPLEVIPPTIDADWDMLRSNSIVKTAWNERVPCDIKDPAALHIIIKPNGYDGRIKLFVTFSDVDPGTGKIEWEMSYELGFKLVTSRSLITEGRQQLGQECFIEAYELEGSSYIFIKICVKVPSGNHSVRVIIQQVGPPSATTPEGRIILTTFPAYCKYMDNTLEVERVYIYLFKLLPVEEQLFA
jgi:hypothetical protein